MNKITSYKDYMYKYDCKNIDRPTAQRFFLLKLYNFGCGFAPQCGASPRLKFWSFINGKSLSSRSNKLLEEIQKMLYVMIEKLNPQPSTLNPKAGQAMIESIVAISVSVMGLLGILAMLGYSLSTNRDVGRKFVATYLAAEGIEIVKSLIDKNYTTTGCSWNGGIGCVSIAGGSSGTVLSYQADYNDNSLSNYNSGNFLKFNSGQKIYSYDTGIATPFKREIKISERAIDGTAGADEIIINVVVSWLENRVVKSVNLEDRFFDWRIR